MPYEVVELSYSPKRFTSAFRFVIHQHLHLVSENPPLLLSRDIFCGPVPILVRAG